MSNLVDHATRELSYLNNDKEFNKGIINVIQAFADMGHSGGSAAYAIPLITELLQSKNLTELTDKEDEWNEVGSGLWQNSRNPEAFSNDRGKTFYFLSEEKDQGAYSVRILHKAREFTGPIEPTDG